MKHQFIKTTVIFSVLLVIITSCNNEKLKEFKNKEVFFQAKNIVSENYYVFINNVEKFNQYSEITTLNEQNIAQIDTLDKNKKDMLIKLFQDHTIENIVLYSPNCILFLINSENGFPNSYYDYYLFYQNSECINKLKKEFDITDEKKLNENWLYIKRRSSMAN